MADSMMIPWGIEYVDMAALESRRKARTAAMHTYDGQAINERIERYPRERAETPQETIDRLRDALFIAHATLARYGKYETVTAHIAALLDETA